MSDHSTTTAAGAYAIDATGDAPPARNDFGYLHYARGLSGMYCTGGMPARATDRWDRVSCPKCLARKAQMNRARE